jgi:hypothetical protein
MRLRKLQLELLVPREWTHPNKELLHAWYTRIGYRPVRSGTIDESYPWLAPLLATPCDFVIYHKDLTQTRPQRPDAGSAYPRPAPDPAGAPVGRQHRIGYGGGASGAAASTGWAEVSPAGARSELCGPRRPQSAA